MRSADEILRDQAAALVHVMRRFGLDDVGTGESNGIWQALKLFGSGSALILDLPQIHAQFHFTARDATRCMPGKGAAQACAVMALYTFTKPIPIHRFLEHSQWIAIALARRTYESLKEPNRQAEAFETLESEFEARLRRRVPG